MKASTSDAPEATKGGLPRAVILDAGQSDKDRVDGATYLDRETFDAVARAAGAGDADSLGTSPIDLSGLTGDHKKAVEEALSAQKKTR